MKKGFTLVEVIISIALIAILVLSISSLNAMSFKTNKMVRQRDNAYNIAKAICEAYKADKHSYSLSTTKAYANIESLNDIDITNVDNMVSGMTECNGVADDAVPVDTSKKYNVIIEFENTTASYNKPLLHIIHVTVTNNDNDKKKVKLSEAKI
jgi:prepilin-type N-terminal cleavage/methylation domain-containing protein